MSCITVFSRFFRPVTEPQRTQSGLVHGLMGVEKKCSKRSAAGVLETPWSPRSCPQTSTNGPAKKKQHTTGVFFKGK